MSGSSPEQLPFLRTGFLWSSADAYLFDIDGTLLNSRDSIHYQAFQNAVRSVCGLEAGFDGVPVHGNTDPLILRAILRRAGLSETSIALHLPQMIEGMCREVERRRRDLVPELCPSVIDLLTYLRRRCKLLVAASGNLEPIGWAKLERAGIKEMFGFGSFSWPRESRTEIFRHGVCLARQDFQSASVCAFGDTPADIQAARAAGIPVIALATGVFSFAELLACGPDACLNSAADLLDQANAGLSGATPRAT
jgi:phosphoglycolate phosphatase-like HAD superfamily hydrolase